MNHSILMQIKQRSGHDFDADIRLIAVWRNINERGWDAWDDAVFSHGRDHDKELRRLLSATGIANSSLFNLYCCLKEEWTDAVDAVNGLAWELHNEKEKALAMLRAERGRLFLKAPSETERKRRQQKAKRTRAQRRRFLRRLDAAFLKDEAVNYMFSVVSNVRPFEAVPLLDRLIPLQRGEKRRVKAIRDGRQPKLLTYSGETRN